jgi:hypothetical protein
MFKIFSDLLADGIAVIVDSPRSRIIRADARRFDAKHMLKTYEDLEAIVTTAEGLAKSARDYLEHGWPSRVAKRIRKQRLAHASHQLHDVLATVGEDLFPLLHRLQDTRLRDSMNYLIGVKPIGRKLYSGAPSVAPTLVVGDDEDSPLLLHIVGDSVFQPKYGQKELTDISEGDPSKFPFVRTVSLEDAALAEPVLNAAEAALVELTDTGSTLQTWIRGNLTVDDLLA